MKFSTIHHIAIIVSDYEKSRDFYVNKLGFSVIQGELPGRTEETGSWIFGSMTLQNWKFLEYQILPNE